MRGLDVVILPLIFLFYICALVAECLYFNSFWSSTKLHWAFLIILVLSCIANIFFLIMTLAGAVGDESPAVHITFAVANLIGFICGCIGTGLPEKGGKSDPPKDYFAAAGAALAFCFFNIILHFAGACC